MVTLPCASITCAVEVSSASHPTSRFAGFPGNFPWLITPPLVAEIVYRWLGKLVPYMEENVRSPSTKCLA